MYYNQAIFKALRHYDNILFKLFNYTNIFDEIKLDEALESFGEAFCTTS